MSISNRHTDTQDAERVRPRRDGWWHWLIGCSPKSHPDEWCADCFYWAEHPSEWKWWLDKSPAHNDG